MLLARTLCLFLGALVLGCGESEPTAPVEDVVVDVHPPTSEPASDVVTADEGNGTEAFRTGPYAADSTLCADPTEALRALMPEALEGVDEPSSGRAEPTRFRVRALEDGYPGD